MKGKNAASQINPLTERLFLLAIFATHFKNFTCKKINNA